jgi:hypothetical protein
MLDAGDSRYDSPGYDPRYDAALEARIDAEIARRWRLGQLAEMKLDPHQLRVYRKYRAWEAEITSINFVKQVQEREKQRGVKGMIRIFVMDISRRWGKTFLVALIFVEDLIRNRGWIKTYATAYLKDVAEIVIPMIEDICEDAPHDVRPIYRGSYKGIDDVYVFPSSGSLLKLVGIDKNPRGLRGRGSHGYAITEAGRVPKLASTIGSVIYSQFMRPQFRKATLILESNAPDDPEHDFDRIFIPDAEARGAYVFKTIDDNEAITEDMKLEFLAASDAIDPEITQLEYYGKRIRSPKKMVCAEFNEERHVVKPGPIPRYCRAFSALDPGGDRDPCGLLLGYWDFARAKLVIVASHMQNNMRTNEIAEWFIEQEMRFWGMPRTEGPEELNKRHRNTKFHHSKGWKFDTPEHAVTYWDGTMFKPNPCNRVSDIDPLAVGDLAVIYDMPFAKAEKYDSETAQNAVRTAFLRDQIEIWDNSGPLAMQCKRGTWRFDREGRRVDWASSDALGHLDCYACLVYMWRDVQHYRYLDPTPPVVTDLHAPNVAALPWHDDPKRKPQDGLARLRASLRPQRGSGYGRH